MLGKMKAGAVSLALKAFIGDRFGEYGEIEELKVDLDAARLTLRALLRGERQSVTVSVEHYELQQEGADVYIVLRGFSSSREWLTLLLTKLFRDKRYKIPAAAAKLLK
ncbi:hypothetical protein [Solimonas sp. SE-A11]|uniref:hypothetical protein n=1 Tax=Solimonas sp. SE-A11 TaxID=3054954 RepID=UPI00259C8B28|nr:hypothetical protein [Solimonas sp. SE-A11]MDM4768791.1 hypothetical protein [Solimonas sp. SE-A11]